MAVAAGAVAVAAAVGLAFAFTRRRRRPSRLACRGPVPAKLEVASAGRPSSSLSALSARLLAGLGSRPASVPSRASRSSRGSRSGEVEMKVKVRAPTLLRLTVGSDAILIRARQVGAAGVRRVPLAELECDFDYTR